MGNASVTPRKSAVHVVSFTLITLPHRPLQAGTGLPAPDHEGSEAQPRARIFTRSPRPMASAPPLGWGSRVTTYPAPPPGGSSCDSSSTISIRASRSESSSTRCAGPDPLRTARQMYRGLCQLLGSDKATQAGRVHERQLLEATGMAIGGSLTAPSSAARTSSRFATSSSPTRTSFVTAPDRRTRTSRGGG